LICSGVGTTITSFIVPKEGLSAILSRLDRFPSGLILIRFSSFDISSKIEV
jgi:hypothetical protein